MAKKQPPRPEIPAVVGEIRAFYTALRKGNALLASEIFRRNKGKVRPDELVLMVDALDEAVTKAYRGRRNIWSDIGSRAPIDSASKRVAHWFPDNDNKKDK